MKKKKEIFVMILLTFVLPGVSLDSEIGPASVFHPPNKETLLNPTSTFGPKPFLFIIKPVSTYMYV